MAQVFISYSRRDLAFVQQLAADLKNAGFDVWYDVSGIGGGSRWRIEIENALKESQYVIIVLSPDSVASEWVEREFLFSSNLKRKIIPLMYRPCDLPLNYVDLNYVDVQGDHYSSNFPKILRALNVETPKRTLSAVPPGKPSSGSKTPYIALIGGAVAVAALLGSSLLKALLAPAPVQTTSVPVTQEVPTSLPASTVPNPSPAPSETQPPTLASPTQIIGIPGMVLITKGIFTMGADNQDVMERPAHTVYLDAYYMDLFEVTNKQYMACVEANKCAWPTTVSSKTRPNYYGNRDYDDYPMINVDWNMARAYCAWRGARLPTEAEWEKAARGEDGRAYPWGDQDVDCTKANYNACGGDTVKVGSYESGKSPYGVYDLAGNVWEWVSDWYQAKYYATLGNNPSNPQGPVTGTERVIRGGSWLNTPKSISVTIRNSSDPSKIYNIVGFRCVINAP